MSWCQGSKELLAWMLAFAGSPGCRYPKLEGRVSWFCVSSHSGGLHCVSGSFQAGTRSTSGNTRQQTDLWWQARRWEQALFVSDRGRVQVSCLPQSCVWRGTWTPTRQWTRQMLGNNRLDCRLLCHREGGPRQDWEKLCYQTPGCCVPTQYRPERMARRAFPKHKQHSCSSLVRAASCESSLLGCQREKPLSRQRSRKHR